MRRTPWLLLLALVAALTLVAAGCGGDEEEAAPQEAPAEAEEPAEEPETETEAEAEEPAPLEVSATIGIIGPFTGDAASIGQEQLNWAQFAVQRFNEENGTNFTLVEGDSQLDPAQGSTAAQQFVSDDSIVAVVGPAGSQVVVAAGPIFTQASMGFVSPSSTQTDITTSGDFPTFHRVVPTDDVQGPTDANFMIEQGAQKVMIIDDQSSYSTGLADAAQEVFEEEGTDVTRESVSQDQTDFSALVSRVDDDTDFVFLPWQLAAGAQVFGQQMAEQGKEATIFGSDGLFSPDDFSIAGSYVSSFAPDITGIDDPEVQELATQYEEQFGDFGTFGPPTFAATHVIMTAALNLAEAGEEITREAMAEAIGEVQVEDSILGQPIMFDENGDLEGAEFFIFQVQEDGSYELVE